MRIVFFVLYLVVSGLPAFAKDMTFDIIYRNHTNIVVADGEITSTTPNAFQVFLDTEPFDGFSFLIDLNSPGGNLLGGIELGRMIREQRLTTRVAAYEQRAPGVDYWDPREQPGICMSACALAFLGGEDRELNQNSVLGFHQFSSAGNSAGQVADLYETETATQIIAGIVHDYIETMGISPTLFSRMSMTVPEEMYIPTEMELETFNIIPPDVFRNFTMEPYADGVIAYSTFLGNVEGRNIVSQITAYCKNGHPYLLLSQPTNHRALDQRWLDLATEMLGGFSLWIPPGEIRLDYPASNIELLTGSEQVAEIRLDAQGREMLMQGAKGSVQLPGALGTGMYFEIKPTQEDRKIIDGAFRLCIDSQQAEVKARPSIEHEQDSEAQLVRFFNQYLYEWSQENSRALQSMEQAYGPSIEFYGNVISREALLREKRDFAMRWPERIYSARPDSFQVSCSGRVCTVATMIDWSAHSPSRGKTARGEAWYELGYDRSTGLIIFENGQSTRN